MQQQPLLTQQNISLNAPQHHMYLQQQLAQLKLQEQQLQQQYQQQQQLQQQLQQIVQPPSPVPPAVPKEPKKEEKLPPPSGTNSALEKTAVFLLSYSSESQGAEVELDTGRCWVYLATDVSLFWNTDLFDDKRRSYLMAASDLFQTLM